MKGIGRLFRYVLITWLGSISTLGSISVLAQEATLIGRASCASATCHGNRVDLGEASNHSLSTFVADDPHATAGLVLLGAQSRAMVVRLDPQATVGTSRYNAVLRERCISCHTTVSAQDCSGDAELDATMLAAGVSCESCHGPAGDWVDEHLSESFVGDSRYSGTSFRDAESIVGRTQTCVRCHVGSRREDGMVRDMNHDLIAAGHPALRFDLVLYNDNLPKHWNDQSEGHAEYHQSVIRTRDVARAVQLAAAAELSSQRAADFENHGDIPWPEFSDYDCFACHQTLRTVSPRTSVLKISSGLPIWNAWHTTRQLNLVGRKEVLEKLSPHRSRPDYVRQSGERVASRYRQVAGERLSVSVAPIDALRDLIGQLDQAPFDWHESAILYLELSAIVDDLARATPEKRDALAGSLDAAERALRFAPHLGSPESFDPAEFRDLIRQRFAPHVTAAE